MEWRCTVFPFEILPWTRKYSVLLGISKLSRFTEDSSGPVSGVTRQIGKEDGTPGGVVWVEVNGPDGKVEGYRSLHSK